MGQHPLPVITVYPQEPPPLSHLEVMSDSVHSMDERMHVMPVDNMTYPSERGTATSYADDGKVACLRVAAFVQDVSACTKGYFF